MKSELEILLPVYNEVNYLEKLLIGVQKCIGKKIRYNFLICEYGSINERKELINKLKKNKIRLITGKNRKGFSKAVQDGLRNAKSDYVLMMDSDGQCNFRKILEFWKYRKDYDSINAYRIKRRDFAYRRVFSLICYFIFNTLFQVPLKYPSFTFIMVNKKVYKSLNHYKFNVRWVFLGI